MEPFEPEALKKRRNIFLIILCILVFVDAGSSFFQMILMPIYAKEETANMALDFYNKLGSNEMAEQMEQIFTAAQALPGWYFVLSSLPFLLAIVGHIDGYWQKFLLLVRRPYSEICQRPNRQSKENYMPDSTKD